MSLECIEDGDLKFLRNNRNAARVSAAQLPMLR